MKTLRRDILVTYVARGALSPNLLLVISALRDCSDRFPQPIIHFLRLQNRSPNHTCLRTAYIPVLSYYSACATLLNSTVNKLNRATRSSRSIRNYLARYYFFRAGDSIKGAIT